jgi:glycosyltransferase involved in cell wall biosynthesis
VSDRITFVGAVDNAELPDLYRTADVYVSASLTDGTSISLLEAMACGVPAIVSDIAGNRPWADEGAVDLFPVRDVDALAAVLARTPRRTAESEAAARVRARVESDADWSRTAAGFADLAAHVVHRHQRLPGGVGR